MKTIKVRIPVVANAKTGEYESASADEENHAGLVASLADTLPGADEDKFVSWVEAEVPVPEHMQSLDDD